MITYHDPCIMLLTDREDVFEGEAIRQFRKSRPGTEMPGTGDVGSGHSNIAAADHLQTEEETMTCWIQITAGRGPEECCWVVAKLIAHIMADAARCGLKSEPIEAVPGKGSSHRILPRHGTRGAAYQQN